MKRNSIPHSAFGYVRQSASGVHNVVETACGMPYMTARTADVEGPLFLRKFGVPFWALARVFGGDPMSWYRMECGLGRFSVVGTTVRTATLPEHLLADEHHQGLDGQKVYIATTVGNGCCLGAEPAEAAGSDKLKVAYQVFKDEACDVSPKYAPKTVSTDGWKGTQAAWKMLFTKVVILLCFLHGWLKIRDRAKHLKEVNSTFRIRLCLKIEQAYTMWSDCMRK